ncbi:MAG: GNAT family N-acetyltransferase [Candidatus Acidiferrales bacterium]
MKIRALELRDIDAVLAMQAASPEIAQWAARDYRRVAGGEMAGWVAEENDGGEIAGFLIALRVVSDLEILNFAVRLDARRQGIGGSLLREALAFGNSFDAEKAFLEVRASNAGAMRFYEEHNFEVTGRRARYYTDPVEDALLLTALISKAGPHGGRE